VIETNQVRGSARAGLLAPSAAAHPLGRARWLAAEERGRRTPGWRRCTRLRAAHRLQPL